MIAEDEIESNTNPTTNSLKVDTIIISPLRDIDIKKITKIQEAIEIFDNTMKETRQKPSNCISLIWQCKEKLGEQKEGQ